MPDLAAAQGVSRRELARLLEVSEGSVRKALKAGIIKLSADGTIDPEAAREAWSANTDPERSQVRTEVRTAPRQVRTVRTAVRTREDARQAVTLILRVLREEGALAEGVLDFQMARLAETILKARERDLRMQVAAGKLVDADAVRAAVFRLARQDRDALANWPARVAPLLAAEVGTDQVPLAVALEKHVREFLAERADPELRLKS